MVEKRKVKSTTKAQKSKKKKKVTKQPLKSPEHGEELETAVSPSSPKAGFSPYSTSSVFRKRSSVLPIQESSPSNLKRTSSILIPTTGAALLQWTRDRMSLISVTSGDEGAEYEIQSIKPGILSSYKRRSIKDGFELLKKYSKTPTSKIFDKILSKAGSESLIKRSKSKTLEKKASMSTADKKTGQAVTSPQVAASLEDEVVSYWKMKNVDVEEDQTAKKKGKSEVRFYMPSDPDLRKLDSSELRLPKKKLSKRKIKKSSYQSKKDALIREEEELIKRKKKEEKLEKLQVEKKKYLEEEILLSQRNAVTLEKIRTLKTDCMAQMEADQVTAEWEQYVGCRKIPFVNVENQITEFIQLCKDDLTNMSMEQLAEKNAMHLELLDEIAELQFYTQMVNVEKLQKFNWATIVLRDSQNYLLGEKVYQLLTDIEKNFDPIDLRCAEYRFKSDCFILCIWVRFDWPVSLPNPRGRNEANTHVNFPEVDVDIVLPPSVNENGIAIQLLYLPYDNFSDTCGSTHAPAGSNYMIRDLVQSNNHDRLIKRKYAYESSLRSAHMEKVEDYKIKYGDETQPSPFVLPEVLLDDTIPEVNIQVLDPTPNEYVETVDEIEYQRFLKNATLELEDEVNLREYSIVGGIFEIHLLYNPPQPHPLVIFKKTMNVVLPPRTLQKVPFFAMYNPPEPPWLDFSPKRSTSSISKSSKSIKSRRLTAKYVSRTDFRKGDAIDSNEVELLKVAQEEWEKRVEEEKQKLIFISLKLPNTVIYLERPIVCLWDETFRRWTERDIYNVTYDNEDKKVTFRTSEFGIFALAVKKHSNFPYQSWDIRPQKDDSIEVVLTGSKVAIHLIISESNITILNFMHDLPKYLPDLETLDDLKSKSFTLPRLIKTLRSRGLDIFPEFDANCYYNVTTEKQWAMSYITYYSMAQMAIGYNFSSSRWNSETNRRSIVLQVREYNPSDDTSALNPSYLVLITPRKCAPLLCTEDDEYFSDQTSPTKFPNLYYLLRSSAAVNIRAKINQFSLMTIHTLARFLVRTRIFSFS